MTNPNPIKSFRESRQLTQTELAEILGVKQSHISEWENGLRPVPLYVLRHLECLEKTKQKEG